jgi:hypothetical protein
MVLKIIKNASNKEIILSHALIHRSWNSPGRKFTKAELRKAHSEVVKIMLKRGIKHNSPLR